MGLSYDPTKTYRRGGGGGAPPFCRHSGPHLVQAVGVRRARAVGRAGRPRMVLYVRFTCLEDLRDAADQSQEESDRGRDVLVRFPLTEAEMGYSFGVGSFLEAAGWHETVDLEDDPEGTWTALSSQPVVADLQARSYRTQQGETRTVMQVGGWSGWDDQATPEAEDWNALLDGGAERFEQWGAGEAKGEGSGGGGRLIREAPPAGPSDDPGFSESDIPF